MAAATKTKTAVMQFEFDRKRVRSMTSQAERYSKVKVNTHAHDIIRGSLQDVFENGGTLVVVVSPEKITVVQRPEAEEI